jgi:hypothetical protein
MEINISGLDDLNLTNLSEGLWEEWDDNLAYKIDICGLLKNLRGNWLKRLWYKWKYRKYRKYMPKIYIGRRSDIDMIFQGKVTDYQDNKDETYSATIRMLEEHSAPTPP